MFSSTSLSVALEYLDFSTVTRGANLKVSYSRRHVHCLESTKQGPLHTIPKATDNVEQFNRTLKVMLSSYTSENQKDWDLHVPAVMMTYRASPQESTGMTPNMLMFGREVELPVDLIFGGIGCPEALEESLQAPDYVVELGKRLDIAHEIARKHLKKSARYKRRHYDHKITNDCYQVGAAADRSVSKTAALPYYQSSKWCGGQGAERPPA